jgi:mannose-6-phosphate isomerase-like protein (cupin superfamily)
MWNGRGQPDRREALFGGVGEVRVWSLMDGALPPFDCVLGCELDPAGSVGVHVQNQCTEVVIVTEGHGEAKVGDATIALTPGVVVRLPLGEKLALANGSEVDLLRYLIVKVNAK